MITRQIPSSPRTMKPAPAIQFFTHAGSLFGLGRIAGELGRDVAPLLTRHGLAREDLADPRRCVRCPATRALLEEYAREWQCPDLGLRMGEQQSIDFLGPVGLLARLTDTVGEALRAFEANMPVYSNAFSVYLENSGTTNPPTTLIHYQPLPGAGCGPQMAELSLCRMRVVLDVLCNGGTPPVLRASFAHQQDASRQRARRFFGAPVDYGSRSHMLHVDSRWLAAPNRGSEKNYAPVVIAYLEQARREMDVDIVTVTLKLIGRLLVTGRCTRDSVAELLHLHPRTYQRRLEDRGTSFAAVLDRYRREQALALVTLGHLSLGNIADCLGYANQSAFNAAFKRWTQDSPLSFRIKQSASGTAAV